MVNFIYPNSTILSNKPIGEIISSGKDICAKTCTLKTMAFTLKGLRTGSSTIPFSENFENMS